MAIKLNDIEKIDFPNEGTWSEFYTKWVTPLVDALGEKHDRMDREDAVSTAFIKLMGKGVSAYGHVPETEKDWYNCILWQAKGALSHIYEGNNTRIRYHKQAMVERLISSSASPVCRIDEEVRSHAAFRTFDILCEKCAIKERDAIAYRRCYLEGESSELVAADLGMPRNNLYQKKLKIEGLLKSKGRTVFRTERRKCFFEAA